MLNLSCLVAATAQPAFEAGRKFSTDELAALNV
jgi:hypothetical protein